MTKQQDLEKYQEENGEVTEDQEWQELNRRRAAKKCTCDLLEPFGHVTCPECNESFY